MSPMDRRSILSLLKGIPVMAFAPFPFLKNAFASRFPTRTVEEETFSFDPSTGDILWTRKKSREPYRLIVDGLVEKPVKLTYEELRALPSVTRTLDFHCVEGWTVPEVKWSGFSFKSLYDLVRPKEDAKYAIFHALGTTSSKPQGWDHYAESFEVKSLLDPKEEMILALEKDGEPLSLDRGAPLRVIAPYRLAYKSIKFVSRVEFSDKLQPGWWTLANSIYDWKALVPLGRLRKK